MPNLLCLLGFHQIKGKYDCACRRRGCFVYRHSWAGCRCSRCEGTRDKGHDWAGCKCSKCKKTRDKGHDWTGCKCSKCEKTRDEGHDWTGCKCTRCGARRHEGTSQGDRSSVGTATKCVRCGRYLSVHLPFGCPACNEFKPVFIDLSGGIETPTKYGFHCPICYKRWDYVYGYKDSVSFEQSYPGYDSRGHKQQSSYYGVEDCPKCGAKCSYYTFHHRGKCRSCGYDYVDPDIWGPA